jgi:hypothetical protein
MIIFYSKKVVVKDVFWMSCQCLKWLQFWVWKEYVLFGTHNSWNGLWKLETAMPEFISPKGISTSFDKRLMLAKFDVFPSSTRPTTSPILKSRTKCIEVPLPCSFPPWASRSCAPSSLHSGRTFPYDTILDLSKPEDRSLFALSWFYRGLVREYFQNNRNSASEE